MADRDRQVRLQVAKQATYISGEELKRHFHGDWRAGSITKGVVEADRASRDAIKTFLSQVYPNDLIWGKGMGEGKPAGTSFWVIDSLNGGENYGTGDSYYATTVAWVENGQPVIGVVSNPFRKQLFHAVHGEGAVLNNEPIHVRQTGAAKDAYLLASFGHGETRAKSIRSIEKLVGEVRQLKVREAPALEIAAIAEGTHDAFVHHGLKPWDWIASRLIVEESGGMMTDLSGKPMKFDSPGGIVSNGRIHKELLGIIGTAQ